MTTNNEISPKTQLSFDIAPQDIATALIQFGDQADVSVLMQHQARGLDTAGLRGVYSTLDGLDALLAGTGLDYKQTEAGIVVFQQEAAVQSSAAGNGKKSLFAQVAAVFAGTVLSGAAMADESTADAEVKGAADKDQRRIEEVIVSALKGSTGTALSDTAMGITALDGAYLEDIAATSINAIVERTPGASLVKTGDTATTIQIRGVSASQGDALVGYYLDDFAYVSLQGVSTPEIIPFDLKRVEVLKGPQGTLYGAGSTGGTIRILSNKADTYEGFSGKVELGAHTISGGGDGHTIAGMVNIPIVADKVALRASAYLRDRAGWLDYDEGPDDYNELDGDNYKVQLGFTPNERLRIDIGYHKDEVESVSDHSDSDLVFALPEGEDHPFTPLAVSITQANAAQNFETAFEELGLGALYPVFEETILEQLDEIYTPNVASLMPATPYSLFDSAAGPAGTLPYSDRDYELYTSSLSYDFDSVQLYVTANKIEENSLALAQTSIARDGVIGKELETSNIELRLASINDGPLNWTAGLFYLDHEETFFLSGSGIPVLDLDAAAGIVTIPGIAEVPVPLITGFTELVLVDNLIESEQSAIFGEVYYGFTDNVELTVGMRYSEDERDATELSANADIMAERGLSNPWSETFDALTGRINLKVNWSEELMTYFSISSAERSGTPNFGITRVAEFVNRPAGYTAPAFTDEEKLIAYEVGAKWFATDSLYVDAALYYNDWEDIILEITELISDPQSGILLTTTLRDNAGDARSYGLEASLNWVPTDAITVTAGFNVMESEYVDPPADSGVNDGDQIQAVPDWTGYAGVDLYKPISWFGGSNVVGGLFASYTGERYSYGSGGVTAKTDGFARLDARVGLDTESWSVVLHVKNLTDSDDRTFNPTAFTAIEPFDIYMQPRTTELVLKYAF
ncbi:MAG: TonB-dependent receptor [Halioglobus sp.]